MAIDTSTEIKELKAKLEYYTQLAHAAQEFIRLTPCDPDIYPEQLEAYKLYKELLGEPLSPNLDSF
jgi:hypothetical protein